MSTETLIFLAAIALTVIGVGAFGHYFLWVGVCWPRTSGKVVGNEAVRRREPLSEQYAYYPRLEFIAADGRTHKVRGDIGRPQEWPLGRIVALRYRPANPDHATIAKGWQRLVFAGVFLGFAVASWVVWLG